MTVTDLDSDIWDPRGNSLSKVVSTYQPVNKRFCLPAVGLTSNICRVSSISCLLLPPAAQTKPPRRLRLLPPPMAGCASAALPYVPSNVGQSLPLFPHTSCYSPATSAPTRTRTRTSQPSYSPPPATGPAHLPRLLFVPSEASSSSSALRPWFARRARCAALLRCQRRQQPRGTRR